MGGVTHLRHYTTAANEAAEGEVHEDAMTR
jgi:hypothetical protein